MGLLAVTLRYRVAPGDATVPLVPSPRSLHQLTAVVRATAGGSRHPPSGSEAPSAGVPGAQHSPPYRAWQLSLATSDDAVCLTKQGFKHALHDVAGDRPGRYYFTRHQMPFSESYDYETRLQIGDR